MKRKYYLTLDTETATMPFVKYMDLSPKVRQQVAIAKPLVYDIGWCITTTQGDIIKKVNYLIQETFFVPQVFNTAYYKNKRPIYMELLKKGEIGVKNWNDVIEELIADLDFCDMACAYNACFDYKKAIPFTERYIKALYSDYYNEWEDMQRKSAERIAEGIDESENPEYLDPIFQIRGYEFPILDLWGMACKRLINANRYKKFCYENNLFTNSAMYFKTSAETSFQYLMSNVDFIEDHTALSDALIESVILTKGLKKGRVEPDITAFPFRELGFTYQNCPKKYIPNVANAFENYLNKNSNHPSNAWWTRVENIYDRLMACL